jgi:hypothetical protein
VRLKGDVAVASEDRHGLSGEVGKQLLAGAVLLTHRALQCLRPVLVALAELRIAIGSLAGMGLDVLLPEQLQRHALAPQFPVNYVVIRLDPLGRRGRRRQRQDASLKFVFFQRFDRRPVQSSRRGKLKILRDRPQTDAERALHLSVREIACPLQA